MPDCGLDGKTPLSRYREDIDRINQLGLRVIALNEVFYHREKRKVRKDGTIQLEGKLYEVPHQYVHQTITVVIDPHANIALYIESDIGERLEAVTLLDKAANLHRSRQRPQISTETKDPHLMDATQWTFEAYERELQLSTVTGITNLTQDKE